MADPRLDQPVWWSLSTVHAGLAQGDDMARHLPPDIGPFAAVAEDTAEHRAHLASMLSSGQQFALAQAAPVTTPPRSRILMELAGQQMHFEGARAEPSGRHDIVRLGEADWPEMLALAELTRPGPFAARTAALGAFWGVRRNGRIIAMAGERMKQPGHTEISGVCTHPDHLGEGLGQDLCLHAAASIVARGEQPYLHVIVTNERAISLYERLGFRTHRTMNFTLFQRL